MTSMSQAPQRCGHCGQARASVRTPHASIYKRFRRSARSADTFSNPTPTDTSGSCARGIAGAVRRSLNRGEA